MVVAELCGGTEKPREVREGANLTGRRWTGLRPRSLLPIYPDGRNAGGPGPCHVELDGITDEDRLLRPDLGEAQSFPEYRWIGFCHAEFLGNKDEVNEVVEAEEFEFRVLYLGRSIRHDPNRASRLRVDT